MDDLKPHVERMIKAGVPEEKIAEFIQKYGQGKQARAQLESYQPITSRPKRDAVVMGGGMLGGMLAAPGVATTPAGIGLGAGIAGQLYDLGEEAVGIRKPRPLGQRLMDSSLDVGINAIAPGATAATLNAAIKLGRAIYGPVKNWTAQASAPQLLRDFTRARVRPDAGAISGNKAVQSVQKGLGYLPGSTSKITTHAQNVVGDLGNYANRVANRFGPVMSSGGAGEVVESGLFAAAKRFRARSNNLYKQVGEFIEPDRKIALTNTQKFISEQRARFGDASEIEKEVNKGLIRIAKKLQKDAADGTINYNALNALREEIGESIGKKTSLFDDVSTGKLKKLYGALAEDILQAFPEGTAGRRAAQRARLYTKMFHDHNAKVIEGITKKASPGKIMTAIQGFAKDDGRQLMRIKRNLTPEEWDVVAGSFLNKMGRAVDSAQNAAGDVFSPGTFLTNWNKVSNEAKNVLFGGTRYAKLKPELDRLVNISGSLKDIDTMANMSGTTTGMNITALFSAAGTFTGGAIAGSPALMFGGPASTAASLVAAPHLAAKLWTSPGFVRWLANGAALAKVRGVNDLSSHVGRLAAVVSTEPDMKEAINAYVHALKEQR